MKRILFIIIFFLSSCTTVTRVMYPDDLYYARPYDRYYFYRKSLLSLNRYNYSYPYFYYQPRIYVQPRPQQPRIHDLNQQKNKPSAPIRKFK